MRETGARMTNHNREFGYCSSEMMTLPGNQTVCWRFGRCHPHRLFDCLILVERACIYLTCKARKEQPEDSLNKK